MFKLSHFDLQTRVLLLLAGITAREIRGEAVTRQQRKRARKARQ